MTSLWKPSNMLCTPTSNQLATAQHPNRLLILSYAWGAFQHSDMLHLFVESLRATGSDADVVVMVPELLANTSIIPSTLVGVQVVEVPKALQALAQASGGQEHVLIRFTAWRHYVSAHRSEYTHVLTTDMDVFFQQDPLKCMPQAPMLQLTEENMAVTIGTCAMHTTWVKDCPAVLGTITGPNLYETIKQRGRICAGTIYGDVDSMLGYLTLHVAETQAHKCNDQGLLNMLTWGGFLVPVTKRVVVFNQFYGPVKNCDVGGYRDEAGYLLNNNGRRYCFLHQFKNERAPAFLQLLRQQLENRKRNSSSFRSVEVIDIPDNRFPEQVHPSRKSTTFPPLPVSREGWEQSKWGFSALFSDGTAHVHGLSPVNEV